MSLVGDYALADDGKWYQHAVLGEGQSWFICFDDDDPPEMVVRVVKLGHKTVSAKSLTDNPMIMGMVETPEQIIERLKLPFKVITKNAASSYRCFPNGTRKSKLLAAKSFFLEQTDVIPARLILKHDGQPTEIMPECQGVFYAGNEKNMAAAVAKQRRAKQAAAQTT